MRSVSRREKYVGIQKQPVHLLGPSVRNRIGIDAKFLDGFSCSAVIRDGGSRGEEEFCFTLGAVPFDGNDDGRTNQDAVFSGFGGHYGAFFDSETFTQLSGNDQRAAFAYFCGFQGRPPRCLNIRVPDIQASCQDATTWLDDCSARCVQDYRCKRWDPTGERRYSCGKSC